MRKVYRVKNISRRQFERLIRHHFTPAEQKKIMRAYKLAKYGHSGQWRESGGRYFEHPKALAVLLIQRGVRDVDVICAALLHDLIEDSYILDLDTVEEWFGSRCCRILKMVTKEPGLSTKQYFRRLSAEGPEAWLVKLADRLHNLSTLVDGADPASQEKFRQKKIKQVQETRQYVLPLALALGKHPQHLVLSQWFVREITSWCDLRKQEATA